MGGESTIMVGRAIDMASQVFQNHPELMGNGGYKLIRYNSNSNMHQPYNGMLQRRSSLDPEDDDYEYSWPFKQVMMSHKRQPAAG